MCLEDGLLNQFHYRREKNEKKTNEIVMMHYRYRQNLSWN